MTSRKLLARSNVVVMALMVLGILAIISYLSSKHLYHRFDMTKDEIYTISDSTKKLLRNLDDIVNIKVYFSEDLPEVYRRTPEELKDLLEEYQAFAKGNVRIEYIDPKDNPELEQKLRTYGIPRLQLQVLKKDKLETVLVYMGLMVMYEDRKEALPMILNIQNLEYELTSALIRVTASEIPVLGILRTGEEQSFFEEEYRAMKPELEKHYRVRDVDISDGKKVPDDIKTLLVMGGESYSERDLYEIDQHIMKGGHVIFGIDAVAMQPNAIGTARPLKTGIEPLIQHMGVKLGDNLVLDASKAVLNFERAGGMMRIRYSQPYPFWPKVQKAKLNTEHPILHGLDSLVFPWPRTLEPVKEEGDQFEVTPLANSSDRSWTVEGFYNLNPMQQVLVPRDTESHVLAALVEGKFSSYFKGKPVPKPDSASEEEGESTGEDHETIGESPDTSIIVLGTSRIANDHVLSTYRTNATFFLNCVDFLTLGDELIGIRARVSGTYPLRELSNASKSAIKLSGILGVPILLILFSILRRFYRRRARIMEEAGYR